MWISYKDRREDCIVHNIPIISIHTENFIKDYLQKHKPKSIIEIGSAVWYSTSILWQTLESYHKQGEIKSREISYPHYRQALQSTSPYKSINIFMGNFCHYNCWYEMAKNRIMSYCLAEGLTNQEVNLNYLLRMRF